MAGQNRKFEVGNTYFGDDTQDTFKCISRDEESGEFEYYSNGEFIDVCVCEIYTGFNTSEELYCEQAASCCNAEYCKETMHDTIREFENMIQTLEDADVLEAYIDEEQGIFYKVARRAYSKPYYFIRHPLPLPFPLYFDCELVERERAEYFVSQSKSIYLSNNDIEDVKNVLLIVVSGELNEYREKVGL